jgi:hypothetical protein
MGATGAAGAAGAGKSIGSAFEKLGKTLQGADGGTSSSQQVSAAPTRRSKTAAAGAVPNSGPAVEKAVPAIVYEDPALIKVGMEFAEINKRFGPPAMKLTTGGGQETLSYAAKEHSLDVEMRDGKVVSIQKTIASSDSAMVRIP